MPIYEYECAGCGARHEFIQKFSEGPKRKCPSCGKLRLKKQISAAAFHLKGDGWYVTDFRDKGKGKADSAESAGDSKPDAKTSDSTPSDSKSSDSKASDSKDSDSKASDSKAGGRAKTGGGRSGGSSRAA